MKKLSLLIMFLFLLLFLLAQGMSHTFEESNGSESNELQTEVYSILQDEKIEEFSLSSVTDFSWDQAHLFPPYTLNEDIAMDIGTDFGTEVTVSIGETYLLVFLEEDKVIQSVPVVHRSEMRLSTRNAPLTPTNDVIMIKRRE
ncbi:hypothetical protein BTR22_04545 [Alkalihalophilus pseudofirmus]|uniref:hypothetical protein n=1 Tax=Alkalihalophilus pseudofirmus TaxID=79885 RepID=UPI000951B084|nr:hypothetical protein BTR22_04545 [Alkalihalophilus pseudofirmus]